MTITIEGGHSELDAKDYIVTSDQIQVSYDGKIPTFSFTGNVFNAVTHDDDSNLLAAFTGVTAEFATISGDGSFEFNYTGCPFESDYIIEYVVAHTDGSGEDSTANISISLPSKDDLKSKLKDKFSDAQNTEKEIDDIQKRIKVIDENISEWQEIAALEAGLGILSNLPGWYGIYASVVETVARGGGTIEQLGNLRDASLELTSAIISANKNEIGKAFGAFVKQLKFDLKAFDIAFRITKEAEYFDFINDLNDTKEDLNSTIDAELDGLGLDSVNELPDYIKGLEDSFDFIEEDCRDHSDPFVDDLIL